MTFNSISNMLSPSDSLLYDNLLDDVDDNEFSFSSNLHVINMLSPAKSPGAGSRTHSTVLLSELAEGSGKFQKNSYCSHVYQYDNRRCTNIVAPSYKTEKLYCLKHQKLQSTELPIGSKTCRKLLQNTVNEPKTSLYNGTLNFMNVKNDSVENVVESKRGANAKKRPALNSFSTHFKSAKTQKLTEKGRKKIEEEVINKDSKGNEKAVKDLTVALLDIMKDKDLLEIKGVPSPYDPSAPSTNIFIDKNSMEKCVLNNNEDVLQQITDVLNTPKSSFSSSDLTDTKLECQLIPECSDKLINDDKMHPNILNLAKSLRKERIDARGILSFAPICDDHEQGVCVCPPEAKSKIQTELKEGGRGPTSYKASRCLNCSKYPFNDHLTTLLSSLNDRNFWCEASSIRSPIFKMKISAMRKLKSVCRKQLLKCKSKIRVIESAFRTDAHNTRKLLNATKPTKRNNRDDTASMIGNCIFDSCGKLALTYSPYCKDHVTKSRIQHLYSAQTIEKSHTSSLQHKRSSDVTCISPPVSKTLNVINTEGLWTGKDMKGETALDSMWTDSPDIQKRFWSVAPHKYPVEYPDMTSEAEQLELMMQNRDKMTTRPDGSLSPLSWSTYEPPSPSASISSTRLESDETTFSDFDLFRGFNIFKDIGSAEDPIFSDIKREADLPYFNQSSEEVKTSKSLVLPSAVAPSNKQPQVVRKHEDAMSSVVITTTKSIPVTTGIKRNRSSKSPRPRIAVSNSISKTTNFSMTKSGVLKPVNNHHRVLPSTLHNFRIVPSNNITHKTSSTDNNQLLYLIPVNPVISRSPLSSSSPSNRTAFTPNNGINISFNLPPTSNNQLVQKPVVSQTTSATNQRSSVFLLNNTTSSNAGIVRQPVAVTRITPCNQQPTTGSILVQTNQHQQRTRLEAPVIIRTNQVPTLVRAQPQVAKATNKLTSKLASNQQSVTMAANNSIMLGHVGSLSNQMIRNVKQRQAVKRSITVPQNCRILSTTTTTTNSLLTSPRSPVHTLLLSTSNKSHINTARLLLVDKRSKDLVSVVKERSGQQPTHGPSNSTSNTQIWQKTN